MNYKIDEGNSRFPEILKMNEELTRIYFDHSEIEREGEENIIKIYTAKYIDSYDNPISAIEGAKKEVYSEIENYDNSQKINEFFINNHSVWLNSESRDKLSKRIEIDLKGGLSTTKLIYNNFIFEIPILDAKEILFQLELYARDCFDKTAEHKIAVLNLDSVKDIVEYDYTLGYPKKLSYTINND